MRRGSYIKIYAFGLLFFLYSCANNQETVKVDFTNSFCDGNSKVWMVNAIYQGNELIQIRNEFKSKVFVFYKTGRFVYGNLVHLFENNYEGGFFLLESDSNYLELQFPKKKWSFIFEFKDENNLILRPEKKSDSDLTFELIPFPDAL